MSWQGNSEVGLVGVVVQGVQDVRRFALRRVNHLDAEGAVLAGVEGVEHCFGVDAVFGVHVPAATGPSARPKILAVGGRRRGVTQSAASGCAWCALMMGARMAA